VHCFSVLSTVDIFHDCRAVQFSVRIGDDADRASCRRPVDRREGVIVDFSTDGGVVWHVLRYLDPFTLSAASQAVILDLPTAAKTVGTVVRWWQPTLSSGITDLVNYYYDCCCCCCCC